MSAKIIHSDDADPQAPCKLPAANCIIAQAEFHALRADVTAILVAVRGDETMGHVGIIKRQDKNENDIRDIKAEFSKGRERLIGIGIGASFVGSIVGASIGLFMDWIKRK